MAAPEVAVESEDSESELDDGDVSGDSLEAAEEMARDASDETDGPKPGDDDPEIETVQLTDDDLDGAASELFTGTEDATESPDSTDDSSDTSADQDDADGDGDPLDALGERGESMEEAINDGAARLAVVGLEGDEKDELRTEFTEVFQAFRLGYFGSRFMEEYVFVDDDDEVDPAWGLLGAALTCTAFIVWMRPDGDEMVGKAKEAVDGIVGGALD